MMAQPYPQQPPPGPDGSQTKEKRAYKDYFNKKMNKRATWRLKVCIGLLMTIFMFLTLTIGIVGVVYTAAALLSDEYNDSEQETASMIIDALVDWD